MKLGITISGARSGPRYSANPVANPGFDSDTSWTKGAGWTIAGGLGVATAASGNLISAALGYQSGDLCLVEADIVVTSGSVVVNLGGTLSSSVTATGRYAAVMSRGASNDTVRFAGTAFTGSVDNVSVRKVL